MSTARERATLALRTAAETANLVAPVTSLDAPLPEGFAVALTQVLISTDPKAGDCYQMAGNWALGRPALEKIASAAGIQWDPQMSRRLDDGRDAHYCAFLAVGRYSLFDGRDQLVSASKEMDLRDGSAQCESIFSDARGGPDAAQKTLRQMRASILRHAESKARCAAVRSLGLRGAYTTEQLAKPFVVARLVFTGQTADPVLRREFALMRARAALGASTSMYGAPASQEAAAIAPTFREFVAELEPSHYEADEPSDDVLDGPPAWTPPAAPAASTLKQGPDMIKFGRCKGKKFSECEISELEWYLAAVEKGVDDPEKSKYRNVAIATVASIKAEIAGRTTSNSELKL